ncbi:MAG: hypothetical protein ACTILG_09470 [Sphingobacterium sp.]
MKGGFDDSFKQNMRPSAINNRDLIACRLSVTGSKGSKTTGWDSVGYGNPITESGCFDTEMAAETCNK